MGLLRLVNSARLAPLEEVLAELSGQTAPREKREGSGSAHAPTGNVPRAFSSERTTAPAPSALSGSPNRAAVGASSSKFAAGSTRGQTTAAVTPAAEQKSAPGSSTAPVMRAESAIAPPRDAQPAAPVASVPVAINVSADSTAQGPVPGSVPSVIARTADPFSGLDAAQVMAIKSAVVSQQKFLGELVEHAIRWELESGEIRLYFPTESRALAELLQGRESMEKLRSISSRVLGQQLRVCVKLEAGSVLSSTVRTAQSGHELRARFEQDPIVRAMLERFGGKISEV